MSSRIAILGAGTIGQTIVSSLLRSQIFKPSEIIATARSEARRQKIADEFGVETTADNGRAVASADIVLVAVKPLQVAGVIACVANQIQERHCLISVAAGVRTSDIESLLDRSVAVVRAMPNTPCLLQVGMTAICAGRFATPSQVESVEKIFKTMGHTVVLEEHLMEAATGLGASGPAFIYLVIDALADGGVKAGLSRRVSLEMAAQATLGAAKMVLDLGQHPAILKDAVTTPAGCTIDGLLALEDGKLRMTLINAVINATLRAQQLAKPTKI